MARRFKNKLGKKRSINYGFVGKYADGKLGSIMPDFMSSFDLRLEPSDIFGEDKLYLCKITVEQVFDSLGRPITMNLK